VSDAVKVVRKISPEQRAGPGWTAAELPRRRKGDPGKIHIACRLRTETATLKWIAAELQMGAWTLVSDLLSRQRPQKRTCHRTAVSMVR
jgi:hypothetical protein